MPQANPVSLDRTLPSIPNSQAMLGPRLLGYVCSFPLTILVLLLIHENMLSGMDLQATIGYGYSATSEPALTGRPAR
ncbi:MAG: hypothetical protein U0792_12635 [Gemmataceae bacterium]